jgi:ferric iron reductase FhuF-like transporter/IucA/IucC family protein
VDGSRLGIGQSRGKLAGVAQPTTRPAPPTGRTPDIAETRAALPPGLRERFDAALPGARAAVLSRLLGALDREPLPGVVSRERDRVERVTLTDGRTVEFRAAAALPFADPAPGLTADFADPAPGLTADFADPAQGLTAGFAGRDPRRTAGIADRDQAAGFADRDPRQAAGFGDPNQGLATDFADPAPVTSSRRGIPATPRDAAGPRDPDAAARFRGQRPTAFDDPGSLIRALWPGAALAAEVDNSVANLALARAVRPAPQHGALAAAAGDADGLGRLEQLVTDGHPLHPCCRTRGGMTTADVLAYAPEHRPVIRLRRLRVPPARWYGDTPPVLYAHPWQAERLRDRYPWLTDAGETPPVRPLMSLRTVAPLDGGDHYKTAVDVQMTSAVRTVSPAAVHNGPRLSALLATLTVDLPLTVLRETAAGAVIVDGEPQRHLAHLRREAPRAGPGETVLPLGALAVPGLLREAAGDDPYRWFAELAAILWTPLVTVLHRGVALEAHGQNTLVVLRGGHPVRILYRDLGGVRVSGRRLRAAGVEPPGLHGDLPSDDPAVLRAKLAAAALGTVAAELITLLTRRGADPERLWATVAAAVRAARTPDVGALLRDPLPVKATTAMRLTADPLDDIWASTDNPLAASA